MLLNLRWRWHHSFRRCGCWLGRLRKREDEWPPIKKAQSEEVGTFSSSLESETRLNWSSIISLSFISWWRTLRKRPDFKSTLHSKRNSIKKCRNFNSFSVVFVLKYSSGGKDNVNKWKESSRCSGEFPAKFFPRQIIIYLILIWKIHIFQLQ